MLAANSIRHARSDWMRCRKVAAGEDDEDTGPVTKKRAIAVENCVIIIGVVLIAIFSFRLLWHSCSVRCVAF
jgi:hypothetical protein